MGQFPADGADDGRRLGVHRRDRHHRDPRVRHRRGRRHLAARPREPRSGELEARGVPRHLPRPGRGRRQPGRVPAGADANNKGEVVLLQATGDIDILDDPTAFNRVVSLTEHIDYAGGGAVTRARNWQIDIDTGEQVTGPLELFDGGVYFGSFQSVTSVTDACEFGQSRLWGVDYLLGPTDPGKLETTPGSGTFTRTLGPFPNQLIMGVAVTQRPTCFVGDVAIDPYLGQRYRVTDQGGGQFQLVAQVGGSGALAPGATIAELTRDLPPPISHTLIESISGALE